MALQEVRGNPYDAGLGLLTWARQPGTWQELDGEYLGRGVDLLKLPLPRFLNVLYHASLERLRYDEKNPTGPRERLDKKLLIAEWELPGGKYVAPVRQAGQPPAWWVDDEEASQSFFTGVGVMSLG